MNLKLPSLTRRKQTNKNLLLLQNSHEQEARLTRGGFAVEGPETMAVNL